MVNEAGQIVQVTSAYVKEMKERIALDEAKK
jgi:hypothetical protein